MEIFLALTHTAPRSLYADTALRMRQLGLPVNLESFVFQVDAGRDRVPDYLRLHNQVDHVVNESLDTDLVYLDHEHSNHIQWKHVDPKEDWQYDIQDSLIHYVESRTGLPTGNWNDIYINRKPPFIQASQIQDFTLSQLGGNSRDFIIVNTYNRESFAEGGPDFINRLVAATQVGKQLETNTGLPVYYTTRFNTDFNSMREQLLALESLGVERLIWWVETPHIEREIQLIEQLTVRHSSYNQED